MDVLRKRADQADQLLEKLRQRVSVLEQKKTAAVPAGPGIHKDVLAHVTKEVKALKSEIQKIVKENEKLKVENAKLKKSAKAGSGGDSSALAEYQAVQKKNWSQVKEKARTLRAEVQELEEENKALRAEVAELKKGGGKLFTDKLTQDQIEWLKTKMRKVKSDVEELLKQKDSVAAEVPCSGRVKQTMDSIKDLKFYFVTEDLAELKREWAEAELGELDDEDFQVYLGRKVRAIEIEEDDDTINCRFDNHDTQWFPVGCLYLEVEAAPAKKEAAPVSSQGEALTMETVKERKYYTVTKDINELKTQWYEAELGELDDEDFEGYLGRIVYAIDIESDDDTINCRFDNHDTQYFPVGTLYKKAEEAKKAAAPQRTKMNMDTIRERKYYNITTDLSELKKEWYEAELGELDDEDFQLYLDRKVYAIDIEEDDDTINVRFDNHDTQWFPVGCLYMVGGDAKPVAKKVADVNMGRTKQTMDSIKERKQYYVTLDLVELKKEWAEAELGELDDEDFQIYLGREVKSLDIEEDDDTVNVRFDNHDTQWFPVGCLYQA